MNERPRLLFWHGAVLVTLALLTLSLVTLANAPSARIWAGLAPGDCAEYCEAHAQCGALAERRPVQQPANAWSSLAFLAVGALASRRAVEPTRVLFVASCVVLGVGSFLFHASVTRETQWLDMVGTYAVVIAIAARGAVLAFGWRDSAMAVAALAADTCFAVFKWRIDARVALPALVLVAAAPLAARVRARELSIARASLPLGVAALALAFRQLDTSRALCWPNSPFQAHALWHLGTATAAGLSFALLQRAR